MSRAVRSVGPFLFVAATPAGGRTFGVREARDQRALADVLRKERLLLMRSWRLPAWASRPRGLSLKATAELNEHLSQLLSRGVPLVEALEVTAQTVMPAARPQVEGMREAVAAGSSFADACAKTGSFDRVTIAVYRAAERTGDLAGACRQLAITAKRQLAVSGKAGTLMIYPAIVLTISVVVTVVMLVAVVPTVGKSLAELGADLPWYTEAMMWLGGFMRANGPVLLLALAGVLALALVGRKQVGAAIARGARRVPMLRDVILAQETARFFGVMAAMTRSGIQLADALGVANEAVNHPTLRKQLTTLRTRLIEGGVLRVLVENVTALPLATRRLLIAAERSGDLEQAFEGLAEDLAADVDRRSSRLLAALEPLLIVVMFLMIGTLLLSIMIPLITTTSQAI